MEFHMAKRNPASRQLVYRAIEIAMAKYPDMRLGQLLSNVCFAKEDIFNIEDDDLALTILEYPDIKDESSGRE